MKYKWLIFDVDDTLLDYQRVSKECLELLFQEISCPYDPRYFATFKEIDDRLWSRVQTGERTSADVIVQRFAELGQVVNVHLPPHRCSEVYGRLLSTVVYPVSNAHALLSHLSANFYLVAATNGTAAVQKAKLETSKMGHYFHRVFISSEVGHQKPAREFFDAVHCALDRPARNAMLMIGDSLTSDIKGALNYGMDACWFNPGRTRDSSSITPTYEISELPELIPIVENAQPGQALNCFANGES